MPKDDKAPLRLDSWKEIARYLGRDVRTAIRWEQELDLPVRRVAGGKISRVFAYTDELDAWLARGPARELATSPTPPDTRIHKVVAIALAIGLLAMTGGLFGRVLPRDPPRRLTVAGNEVVALDATERAVWTHRFDAQDVTTPAEMGERWAHVGDIDGDRRTDVIATLFLQRAADQPQGSRLLRFSGDGALQWSAELGDRLTFREGTYGPPWAASDMNVYRAGGETRVAWALHHFTWWPAMLVTMSARGERRETFVNSGWIRAAAPSRDRRHLLLVGVNNAWQSYFFAVLDSERPGGHSPQPPGSPTECVGCPEGDPVHYVVFPRTDVGREQPFPAEGPTFLSFDDGTVQVQLRESASPRPAVVIYEFSPEFEIRRASFSDSYWEWHRRFEAEGILRHRSEAAPERQGLEVQRWTPATSWQAVRVPVF